MFSLLGRVILIASLLVLLAMPASAQDLRGLVDALGKGGFAETEQAIYDLAATGDPEVAPVLRALQENDLVVRKMDGRVFRAERGGAGYTIYDVFTGEQVGQLARSAVERVRVNNNLRRVIGSAVAVLTLHSPEPHRRARAADTLVDQPDPAMLAALDDAIAAEQVSAIRARMEQARAAILLAPDSDATESERISAVEMIAQRGDRDALVILEGVRDRVDGEIAAAAERGIADVERAIALRDAAQNVWYGISLGSVLLLAAIGLAITFGVMGVINLAHGEMVMLGAYVTFVVQSVLQAYAPGLLEASVLIAIPVAFLVAGAVGIAIERGVIRFLYGRPLETLLATWGLSLILQQAVRTIFGSTNRQVTAPDWISGAFDFYGLTITWNRLYIVIFALIVFAGLVCLLRYSSFGLRVRAVTQNRRMAGSMGIRTPWVDAMTFGLGSGIAGMGGVALSQIDNVSPNLGQNYIVDSFMVVVFGGAGNLWGTLVGAFTLGVANKFLEPYAGAVLGKILVLVFIILFIQRYPRGLFALKGRAGEA